MRGGTVHRAAQCHARKSVCAKEQGKHHVLAHILMSVKAVTSRLTGTCTELPHSNMKLS